MRLRTFIPPVLATALPARLVLAGERAAEIVAFEAATVAFFVDAGDLLGVPRSVAAIYGVVFASPEPLSFSEIEERLDISKGSISQGLRVLRHMGALRIATFRSQRTDDSTTSSFSAGRRDLKRRDSFEPDLELRKLIVRWLEGRLQKQLIVGRGRLQNLTKSVPGGRTASAKVLHDRLKSLQNWHGKGRALMPVVKTFLKIS